MQMQQLLALAGNSNMESHMKTSVSKGIYSALMASLAIAFAGCDPGAPEPTTPGPDTETEVQAHTVTGTITAQEGTTAQLGITKWNVTYDQSSHKATVKGVDSTGKTVGTVTLTNTKAQNGKPGTVVKVTAFGETASATIVDLDNEGHGSGNVSQSGLPAEVVGALSDDANHAGPQSCFGAIVREAFFCGVAALEDGLNVVADVECYFAVKDTTEACR
jgi:hypothetical protein